MKKIILIPFLLLFMLSTINAQEKGRILVFTKTEGFVH